jgi:hypothetical protein
VPVAGRTGFPHILGEPASPEEAGPADGSGARCLEGITLGSGGAHTYSVQKRAAMHTGGLGTCQEGVRHNSGKWVWGMAVLGGAGRHSGVKI